LGYSLGIDLGTTYTAAAIRRGDVVEVVQLGTHGAAIPSVVLMRDDGSVLTGEAAEFRALSEPGNVAREFKRRTGDSTPILLGGRPQGVASIMARLLRSVVELVSEREGEAPSVVVITHPANWGEFKIDVLRQAARMAEIENAEFVSEPEAAAIQYAAMERMPDGATIAVYDLGGGTFDAAVLQKTESGFKVLGPPEGIERLGGIDFDVAVLHFVTSSLEIDTAALESDYAGLSRLRADCIAAKEALSTDVDVTIPVMLPDIREDVRLTRTEFEELIRPAIDETVAALKRAITAAGITAADLHAVLLVGGSSRIPLVAEIVGSALNQAVAIDTHPKHAVAMGAARIGHTAPSIAAAVPVVAAVAADPPETSQSTPPTDQPTPGRSRWIVGVAAAVVLALVVVVVLVTQTGSDADPPVAGGQDTTTTLSGSSTDETVTDEPEDVSESTTTAGQPTTTVPATTTTVVTTTTSPEILDSSCTGGACVEIGAVAIVGNELGVEWSALGFVPDTSATHAHFYWNVYDSNQVGTNADSLGAIRGNWELTDRQPFVAAGDLRIANRPTGATGVCGTPANSAHEVVDPNSFDCAPLPPFCTGEPCVAVDAITIVDGQLEIEWSTLGFVPDTSGTHAHFYWNVYDSDQVGTNASTFGAVRGNWELTDKQLFVPSGDLLLENRPEDATGICVTPASAAHGVINPANYHCVPLPPSCPTPLQCLDSVRFELPTSGQLVSP